MMNHCIRTGIAENISSLRALSLKSYKPLAPSDTMSCYRLCAIGAAVGVLRTYRKAVRQGRKLRTPRVRRLRATTCYRFKVQDGHLLLPRSPKRPIRIPLTSHVQASLEGYEIRSVTITPDTLSLTYAKHVRQITPRGFVGIDANLDNVTLATSEESVIRHVLSEATLAKSTYKEVRSHMKRNEAKRKHFGIAMENLTGMRRLYQRGDWKSRAYRGRMNSWSFAELQCRQVNGTIDRHQEKSHGIRQRTFLTKR